MDKQFYEKAIRFLARRSRSEKEVHDNLFKKYLFLKLDPQQKQEIENKIAIVIAKLREQKFVNDKEFAKWWIEQRNSFRPKGWRVLELELRQKGISAELIKELRIMNYESRDKNERDLAIELVQKRIKKYKGLTRQELYQKVGGFLARRGFDLDTIKSCIDEVLGK